MRSNSVQGRAGVFAIVFFFFYGVAYFISIRTCVRACVCLSSDPCQLIGFAHFFHQEKGWEHYRIHVISFGHTTHGQTVQVE